MNIYTLRINTTKFLSACTRTCIIKDVKSNDENLEETLVCIVNCI